MAREEWGPAVSDQVINIWKQQVYRIERNGASKEEAFNEMKKQLKAELPRDISKEIQQAEDYDSQSGLNSQAERDLANGELHPDEVAHTLNQEQIVTPPNEDKILMIDGNSGTSGFLGFRDSHYYTNQDINNYDNMVTSISMVPGAGLVSAWAETTGNFYVDTGGSWSVTWEYYEQGLNAGGNCDYKIWIQEEGSSSKNFEVVKSPSLGGSGWDSRSRQYFFDDDTVYNFGFRLSTAASGIGKVLADWQTINAGGSYRGLRNMEASIDDDACCF